jgi:sacsin
MINQLGCFSLLNTKWEHPFQGTIIRMPLRNASQAKRSEISKTETLTNDIQHSMEGFASDMGSSGLLFLKSVQHIVFSINDELLSEVEVINRQDLTG